MSDPKSIRVTLRYLRNQRRESYLRGLRDAREAVRGLLPEDNAEAQWIVAIDAIDALIEKELQSTEEETS